MPRANYNALFPAYIASKDADMLDTHLSHSATIFPPPLRCAMQLSVAQLALAAPLISLSPVTPSHPILTILFHLPSSVLVPQHCSTCPCHPSHLRPLPSHHITPHLHYPVSPALPCPCSSPVEPSHSCLVSRRRHQTMCSPTKFHHPCLTIDSVSRLVT